MKNKVRESSSKLQKSSGLWEAVLITPGQGSSGFYSEEMLREYGPKAFPKGSHSYVDHPKDANDVRSPKNIMGVLAEDAVYEDGRGLVGKIEVMPHWSEFVEAVAPHTGLSIYALSEGEMDDSDNYIVEALVPDTFNTVDLVSYAGRGGSLVGAVGESAARDIERLYESAIDKTSAGNGGDNAGANSAPEEEGDMDIKDVENLLDAKLAPIVASIDAVQESARGNAQAEADADAVSGAVSEALATYQERVEAIEAADLLPSQEKALKAKALKGEDVAEAIESAKEIAAEARGSVAEEGATGSARGRVGEGNTNSNIDLGRAFG